MPSSPMDEAQFVPIPSVGHELGVMFGFLGAMLLALIIYVLAWQYGNKVGARREAERIEALKASGWLREKQELNEERREDREIPM